MTRKNGVVGTNKMEDPIRHSQITQPSLMGDRLSATVQQLRTRLTQSPALSRWARRRVNQWWRWLTAEEKEKQRLLTVVDARINDLTEEAGWRFWLFGRNRSQALAQAKFEKQVLEWFTDTGRTHRLSSKEGETVFLPFPQKKWWQVLSSSQYSRTSIDVLFMGIAPGALPEAFSLQKVLTLGATRGEDRLFNQPVADFRKSLAQWPWWRRLWRWTEYRKYQHYLRGYEAMCANRTLQDAAQAANAIERDLLEPRADLSSVLAQFSAPYGVLQHPATQRYQRVLLNILCQLSQGCCYDATYQEMLCAQLSVSPESKRDDSVKPAIEKLSALHETWHRWLEQTFTASRSSVSQEHWQRYYQWVGQLNYRWDDEQYEKLQNLLGQLKALTEQEVQDLRALIREDSEGQADAHSLVTLWGHVRRQRLETLGAQWQQVKDWHTRCMQTDKTFNDAYQRLRNDSGSSVATCYKLYAQAQKACQTALKAWEASVPADLDTRDGPGLAVERYRTFFKQRYDTIKSEMQQCHDRRVKKAYEKSQGIPALVRGLQSHLKEEGLVFWHLWWQTYSTANPFGGGKAGTKATKSSTAALDEFTQVRRQIETLYREIEALYQYQLSRRDRSPLGLAESALALDLADLLGEKYHATQMAEAEKWYDVYRVLMSWVDGNKEELVKFSQIAQDFSSRCPVGGNMSVYDPVAGCAMEFRYKRDRRRLEEMYKNLGKLLAKRPVDEVGQHYCTQWLQRCYDEAVQVIDSHYKDYEARVKAMASRWDNSKRVCREAFRWTSELEQAHKEIRVQESDRDYDCKEIRPKSAVPGAQEQSSTTRLTPAHWSYHYHTILVDFFIRIEHWLNKHLHLPQGRKKTSADFKTFFDAQCREYQRRGKQLAVHFYPDKRRLRQAPHPAVSIFLGESLSWTFVDEMQTVDKWAKCFADTRAHLLSIFRQSEGHEKALAWASATRYVHQCKQLLNLAFASHRYPVLDDRPVKENPLGYVWQPVVDLEAMLRADEDGERPEVAVANDSGAATSRARQEASSATTDSLGQMVRLEGGVFSESALAPLGKQVRPRGSFRHWQREMDVICDEEYAYQLDLQDARMRRYETYKSRKATEAARQEREAAERRAEAARQMREAAEQRAEAARQAREESERQLANLCTFLIAQGYNPDAMIAMSISARSAETAADEGTAAAPAGNIGRRADGAAAAGSIGLFATPASPGVGDVKGVTPEVLPEGQGVTSEVSSEGPSVQ
jgi:hypothetical protein